MKSLTTRLIQYAIHHLGLPREDGLYWHPFIQKELLQTVPLALEELSEPDHETLEDINQAFIDHYSSLTPFQRNQKINRILGLLTPPPSTINHQFWQSASNDPLKAFEAFHALQVANFYIQKNALANNIRWDAVVNGVPLEITINLSKPEKNNAETAQLRLKQNQPTTDYPACLICKQNLGYGGSETKVSRENMRHLSFHLNDQPWFLQFSPYAYYPYHCIVIDEQHTPMVLDQASLRKLYAFIDLFPYLFIGMNSDLPIVGGSILNHAHFQGGQYTMPMMKVGIRHSHIISGYSGTLHELEWLNNAFRYDTTSRDDAESFIERVNETWKTFQHEPSSIIPYTDQRHNSLTVIVKKEGSLYQTYFILRNNRTDAQFPQGIFHAHPEFHSIKQESIGLIEAMGLFILPGRLKQACIDIENLPVHAPIPESLVRYTHLIKSLRQENPKNKHEFLINEINQACFHILENTAVFKPTPEGKAGLKEWIHGLHR